MGLDTVELVIAIEEEFEIGISDDAAEQMITVGDVYDFVLKALRAEGRIGSDPRDEPIIWERVRAHFVDQLGVNPNDVTMGADIVEGLHAD